MLPAHVTDNARWLMEVQEKIYHNGKDCFEDLFQDLELAQSSIDIDTYILKQDHIGKRLLSLLVGASQRGLKVRLLIDGFGSIGWIRDHHTLSKLGNFQIRIFHPLPLISGLKFKFESDFFQLLTNLRKRNHKKLMIIDQKKAYVGSLNFWEDSCQWRETALQFNHSLSAIQKAFDYSWSRSLDLVSQKRSKNPKIKYQQYPGVRVNFNLFLRKENNAIIFSSIIQAKQCIWLMTPYFAPPMSWLKILGEAAERGVDVRLLLPFKTDVPLIKWVNSFDCSYLLKKGVQVREYTSRILHAKVSFFDEDCWVGSSNFDYLSLLHNLELDIALQTTAAKLELKTRFEQEFKESQPVTLEQLGSISALRKLASACLARLKSWF